MYVCMYIYTYIYVYIYVSITLYLHSERRHRVILTTDHRRKRSKVK